MYYCSNVSYGANMHSPLLPKSLAYEIYTYIHTYIIFFTDFSVEQWKTGAEDMQYLL